MFSCILPESTYKGYIKRQSARGTVSSHRLAAPSFQSEGLEFSKAPQGSARGAMGSKNPPCILEPLFFSAQHCSQNPGFVLRPRSPCAIALLGVAYDSRIREGLKSRIHGRSPLRTRPGRAPESGSVSSRLRHIIGWANNHFNNLHFNNSLERKKHA